MQIAVRASENQKQELIQKDFGNEVTVHWIDDTKELSQLQADAYFDLLFDDTNLPGNTFINDIPVFVNAVNCVCREINKSNYVRLNAWNGFLSRPVTELVCCNDDVKKIAENIFQKLGWNIVFVADDYGFVAARIIAMIINEAYYALEENVSSKQQIDVAMQLGTNYAYGPFAWSEKIGLKNVLRLLQKLASQNERYTLSSLLVHESQQF